jgi:hypothetical protein
MVVFDFRGEPAQVEITIGPRDHKRGFGMFVFGRNLLHGVGREKGGKDAIRPPGCHQRALP